MRLGTSVSGLVAAALAGLAAVSAKSAVGNRLAVILDAGTPKDDYSAFFGSLQQRGFDIHYAEPKSDFSFFHLEERAYDHAILFPQKSKGLGPELTPQALSRFVEAGGNLLIGASSTMSPAIRDFARELGIELADRDSLMVDHFKADKEAKDDKHTTLLLDGFVKSPILSSEVVKGAPVIFKGVGHALGNSPLLQPILQADSTAYSYDTKEEFEAAEAPWVAGKQAYLVSALQARNNARVVVAGSVDLFSDAAMTRIIGGKQAGNALFARDVTQWVFQEKAVIRAFGLRHALANTTFEETLPSMYRVKNEVAFEIQMQQWKDDRWVPYTAADVQLELIMLDPYIRANLEVAGTTTEATRYIKTFMLPDHYGVFHFKVNYKRPGLSYIEERQQVTIRHYRHDEYPRFLSAAWPYYASTATVIAGFLVFSGLWLFNQPTAMPDVKKAQ
ncbi:dolichyl-di-phosphooligosaccharide-protein glycotransferase subunit [Protomyces lactucae-debilis]|uniref:Dolichyl-diphosphooligosaccharide--protein glycosyltransferase subunit WBP1 n=1 Tax=Protomyces lactucae-debilis TaxID=2754530 RepID=A0A1Y2FNZ8_PROLT|nr:dolichyl-di-phosphooligosaccharide-protein glycotransferase subunit [Protomyces lactucae-debilis]ORY84936.1 dolichyl-di-phosphooligosaccharide-protein glycotransferase subunit [Protomyces lactucae-debilis]